jgi:hypothetical protein
VIDEYQQAYIQEKREELGEEGIKNAELCTVCNTKSLILMDGCITCVSCGFSKCS